MEDKPKFTKEIEDDFFDPTAFNKLSSLFGDNFPELVKKHNDSAQENIERINKAITNNDREVLERTAHSMKGVSAQFGGIRLSHLAENMEKFGAEGDFKSAQKLYPSLKKTQQETAALMLKKI